MSQNSSWTQGRTQAQGDLLLRHKLDGVDFAFHLHRIDNRRVTIWTVSVHRRSLPRELRTLQHVCSSRSGLNVIPASHQTLTCLALGASCTTSTSANWHLCDLSLLLSHLRDNSRYCLAVWHYTEHAQVMCPTPTSLPTLWTVRWIWAEQGFSNSGFDAWRRRRKFSHVRYPVAAFRECTSSVEHNVLTSWRQPRSQCSQSPTDTTWTLQVYLQFQTSRCCTVGYTPSTRGSERAARNCSTCYAPSTRRISCCYSSIWSGCEPTPCQYFGTQQWSTHHYNVQMQVRQLEHEADTIFAKTKGTVIAIFPNHILLLCCMQTTERWQGKLRTCQRCVRIAKASRFGRPCIVHWWSIFWMYSTSRTCQEPNCDGKRKLSSKLINTRTKSKIHHSLEPRHGRSRLKVHWTLLRIVPQDDCPTKFPHRPPETTRSGNCWRISRDLVSGSIDMLVFSKNWKTRSTLDSWLLGRISHKVERSMMSSIGTSHQLYPSHYQLQTLIVTLEVKQWIVNWN